MKFNFKIQQYQTDAVEAVCNVFAGQGYNTGVSYRRDIGKTKKRYGIDGKEIDDGIDLPMFEEDIDFTNDSGFKNEELYLSDDLLLKNIHEIQNMNNIKLSSALVKDLGRCNLDIEMETGTGKTYVYIKTMFELY